MKTLKCDICDYEAKGETFEKWMNALMPHYNQLHAEFMQNKANLTDEEKKKEMQKWMEKNKARFDVT
jgi:hypothetical protein